METRHNLKARGGYKINKSNRRWWRRCSPFPNMNDVSRVSPDRRYGGSGDPMFAEQNKNKADEVAENVFHDKVANDVAGGKKKRRKIAKFFRAIFFHTSLVKKIKSRKFRKQATRPQRSSLLATDRNNNIPNLVFPTNNSIVPETLQQYSRDIGRKRNCSNISSSFTTPGIFSLCTSPTRPFLPNSRPSTLYITRPMLQERKNRSLSYGLWLFSVGFIALVMWGKVCAIFCSSIWLLFMPGPALKLNPASNRGGQQEVDSQKQHLTTKLVVERFA